SRRHFEPLMPNESRGADKPLGIEWFTALQSGRSWQFVPPPNEGRAAALADRRFLKPVITNCRIVVRNPAFFAAGRCRALAAVLTACHVEQFHRAFDHLVPMGYPVWDREDLLSCVVA